MSRAAVIAAPLQRRSLHATRNAAHIVSIGTATPKLRISQDEFARKLADLWKLDSAEIRKWQRIVAGAGIQWRHGVAEPEHVMDMPTSARMREFDRAAPALASEACAAAMKSANVAAHEITDLIVVTCTGFCAPGVDAAIVRELGLAGNVRRTVIGFMGCFGAIIGLRAAMGAVNCDPQAIALVVCVELCSLHVRRDVTAQNQVATALFADGAAAAVVSGSRAFASTPVEVNADSSTTKQFNTVALQHGGSLLLSEGKDWLTWQITERGFAMTLMREVPIALRQCIGEFVARLPGDWPKTFIVHPGGPGILDAVDQALELDGRSGLEISRAVLADCGNMSSATVLFALERAMRVGLPLPAAMIAFGPGLSVECVRTAEAV